MLEQERISHFVASPEHQELYDIARESVVFEKKIFPGHTSIQLLPEVETMMNDELKIPVARIPGPHHLHIDVQRHRLDEERQQRNLSSKFNYEYPKMQDNSLKETGLFSVPKTKKSRKGPSTTYQNDAAVRRERSPSFQCLKSFVQRNIASEDG